MALAWLRQSRALCPIPALSLTQSTARWRVQHYASFPPRRSSERRNREHEEWANLLSDVSKTQGTPEELWLRKSKTFANKSPTPDTMYSGRRIKVLNGDVGVALSRLHTVMIRNEVFAGLRRDSRHERKGDMRRRLSSERWRRRFKNEVREKVKLVEQMRRRGWTR